MESMESMESMETTETDLGKKRLWSDRNSESERETANQRKKEVNAEFAAQLARERACVLEKAARIPIEIMDDTIKKCESIDKILNVIEYIEQLMDFQINKEIESYKSDVDKIVIAYNFADVFL